MAARRFDIAILFRNTSYEFHYPRPWQAKQLSEAAEDVAIELDDFGRRFTCGKDARAPQTSGNGQSDNLFHEQNLTEDATNKFAQEGVCKAD